MNLLTTGEQENLRETYSQVTLNADYRPTESDTLVEHVVRSGRTVQGVVADSTITVYAVIDNT